jgi:TolB-like protein
LQNLNPDPNGEYFVDGMTEELISPISNISGLSIISRKPDFINRFTSKQMVCV